MGNSNLDAVVLFSSERHAPSIAPFLPFEPTVVKDQEGFQVALLNSTAKSLWVCDRLDSFVPYLKAVETDWLTKAVQRARSPILLSFDDKVSPSLLEVFYVVVARKKSFLTDTEIAAVLRSERAEDLVIGGGIDRKLGLLKLLRGSFTPLLVPLSSFAETAVGVKPDFDDFSIVDHGQTLRFGKYEAAVDAVLYEFDPDFRKRRKRELIESERSFGASLRRLRLQRGMKQSDFPEITEREIGRIERGQVKRPHGKTLDKLAKALTVEPDEIQTY